MCGIVGIWSAASPPRDSLARAVSRLAHRGPDDSGTWFDAAAGIGLGHARLAILDLSPAGHQPMLSADGRYTLVFNGEIYNHLDLRKQLAAEARTPLPAWRGHSDTETLLACFCAWGVATTLQATVGMFALALWDRAEKKLVLARDRLGEKPLYYGYAGDALVFGSELKALQALPGFAAEIDRGPLALLLRHNYIPAPYCIYRGLAKLLPGTWLEFAAATLARRAMPVPTAYWSAVDAAQHGIDHPLSFADDAAAIDALEAELRRAIAGQMMADVPLGAFLSGGIDSSVIVALMQAQSRRPVKTFSIGFRENGYDEAGYAAAVARHLGTEHTELYVSAADTLGVIPRLPALYDEPFADPSQVPTFLLAQLARRSVTVSLSGDGGDELFGGYTRYLETADLWRKIARIPHGLRRALAAAILAVPAAGAKLHRRARLLRCADAAALYRQRVSHWEQAGEVVNVEEPATRLTAAPPPLGAAIAQMMLLDTVSYLPDGVLVKVDRAAMANSLETRVPLIDHRVVEFAWRLPMRYKLRDRAGKWLLRQVLYRHVPQALIDRPKMGFGVPIAAWLRGPLRDWAEDLLDEQRLRREGFFHPGMVRQKWREHLAARHNREFPLWNMLMFQAWQAHNRR